MLPMLLAFLMAVGGLTSLTPLTAKASDWDTENITDIYILPETTRSVTVSFHLSRAINLTDSGRLCTWINAQTGDGEWRLYTFYDFDISKRYIDFGTTVGDYSHTFKGLTPDTLYRVVISASEPGWSEATGNVTVHTPVPGDPDISLDMGWYTATSVRLKGEITNTGTGPGPYRFLAEELKSNALVIVPKTQESGGNLSVSDPNAVVVFDEPWSEPNNVFDHYTQYIGLTPDTEYVAQVILTNIYDNTGFSNKVYFKTFAYPQIKLDSITPRSYDAYIYAQIELDTGDSLSSLGLYADDDDAQQPKDDPARVAGSLIRFDDSTDTAMFRLAGLLPDTAYDVQVFTHSGAGE
jgi:hypothetical protein